MSNQRNNLPMFFMDEPAFYRPPSRICNEQEDFLPKFFMDDTPSSYHCDPINRNEKPITESKNSSKYKLDIDIQRGDLLIGTFGKHIYKAEWLSNRDKTPIVLIEMSAEQITSEIHFYLTLKHKHIIKTFGLVDSQHSQTNEDTVHLLQEYAKDGDLAGLLITRTFNPAQHVLLEIFKQIADAMIYLADKKIVHGDLGCRNVLVYKTDPNDSKKNLVKLSDFGLSRTNSQFPSTTSDYPIRFAAPEILRNNGQSGYSEKSDVYSFGVFIWEACSQGIIPFNHINNDNDVCQLKLDKKPKQLEKPKKCDNNFWILMKLCWKKDPEDRPSFSEIHQQLQDIQKIDLSSSRSFLTNSNSIDEEERSSLFTIQYEICSDCNLRYTHYESHLNRCIEQKIPCDMCSQTYRRADFENHWPHCNGLSNQIVESPPKIPLRKTRSERNPRPKSEFKVTTDDTKKTSLNDIDRSQQLKPKHSVHQKTKDKPIPPKIVEKEDEFSCQICEKNIPVSKLAAHEIQCKKEHDQRIEDLRNKIEIQTIREQAECSICKRKIDIKDIEDHEKTCSTKSDKSNGFFAKLKKLVS